MWEKNHMIFFLIERAEQIFTRVFITVIIIFYLKYKIRKNCYILTNDWPGNRSLLCKSFFTLVRLEQKKSFNIKFKKNKIYQKCNGSNLFSLGWLAPRAIAWTTIAIPKNNVGHSYEIVSFYSQIQLHRWKVSHKKTYLHFLNSAYNILNL